MPGDPLVRPHSIGCCPGITRPNTKARFGQPISGTPLLTGLCVVPSQVNTSHVDPCDTQHHAASLC